MSEKCLKCFRPLKTCYCRFIKEVDPEIKFIFLMHPVEAYRQRTGTGRLASLSLKNSEIIIGESFDKNKRVCELLSDQSYFPLILYPGKISFYAETFNFSDKGENRKLLIFLIDGTWKQARKIMFHSRILKNIPRITFRRRYHSKFRIKKQPADYCLSTIESAYYLIKELRKSGFCGRNSDPEPLMAVFERMVQFQIDCENKYSPIEKSGSV